MSDYEYTTIDGKRVEKRVANDFEKMAAAFKRQFGLELLVTSGVRSTEEQTNLRKKFESGRGNQAAKPGMSRHEENNPVGPRALDLRDSGKDRGVVWLGTRRSNWLRKNAPRFNFVCTGINFKNQEPWHYEWQGKFSSSKPSETKPSETKPPQQTKPRGLLHKASPNKYGLDNVLGLQKIANLYAKDGRKTAIDNVWGEKSQEGFDRFLEKKYGSSKDRGLANWLRTRWGYKGDDKYGPNMKAALVIANERNFIEL